MADSTITNLTELTTTADGDLLPIVDLDAGPATTKKISTLNLVKNNPDVVSNTAHKTSDGKDHSDVVLNNSHRALISGNPHAVTSTEVGLGNVDNTSDADKPVSTAQQTALDLKYDASNPAGYVDSSGLDARDTANRARANHTGTQLANTISDFTAAVEAASTILVSAQQRVGVTLDPTRNNATPVLLEEMTIALVPASATNLIYIKFNGSFRGIDKKDTVDVTIYIDNNPVANMTRQTTVELNKGDSISMEKFVLLSATPHTIEARWSTGTLDTGVVAIGDDRVLIVEEWKK